jgi:hypothetical protein
VGPYEPAPSRWAGLALVPAASPAAHPCGDTTHRGQNLTLRTGNRGSRRAMSAQIMKYAGSAQERGGCLRRVPHPLAGAGPALRSSRRIRPGSSAPHRPRDLVAERIRIVNGLRGQLHELEPRWGPPAPVWVGCPDLLAVGHGPNPRGERAHRPTCTELRRRRRRSVTRITDWMLERR